MNARDKRIEDNLGLVHACANRFRGRGIEYDDLFAAGCLGLIKAVDNFDESRGLALSTYAVPVILGEIKQLFRDGGAVKISRSLKELSLKARAISADYSRLNGCEIPISLLAEKLGVDVYKAAEALNASRAVLSLTIGGEEREEDQWDIPVESQEERIAETLSLRDALDKLEEKDRQLIELRYFKHRTQTQTARILGMTQVQVSRREKKLLLVLRTSLGA